MATLLELWTIEANSRLPLPVPEPVPEDDVTKAIKLLRKIRSAGMRAAEAILDDQNALPTVEPARTEALEKIAWARQTLQYPDGSADALLRLSLADAPAAASVNAILSADETQIQNTVNKMVPRLAKGLQVSPR